MSVSVLCIVFFLSFGLCVQMEDTLWSGLTDTYTKLPMAITAENLAEQYGLTREAVDQYALQSQVRWGQGIPTDKQIIVTI